MQIFRQGNGKKMKIYISDIKCRANGQRNTQAESDSAEWKKEKREADDSRTGQRITNGQGMVVGLQMRYFGLTHWR